MQYKEPEYEDLEDSDLRDGNGLLPFIDIRDLEQIPEDPTSGECLAMSLGARVFIDHILEIADLSVTNNNHPAMAAALAIGSEHIDIIENHTRDALLHNIPDNPARLLSIWKRQTPQDTEATINVQKDRARLNQAVEQYLKHLLQLDHKILEYNGVTAFFGLIANAQGLTASLLYHLDQLEKPDNPTPEGHNTCANALAAAIEENLYGTTWLPPTKAGKKRETAKLIRQTRDMANQSLRRHQDTAHDRWKFTPLRLSKTLQGHRDLEPKAHELVHNLMDNSEAHAISTSDHLIAYRAHARIYVKTIHEPYAKGTSSRLALQHAAELQDLARHLYEHDKIDDAMLLHDAARYTCDTAYAELHCADVDILTTIHDEVIRITGEPSRGVVAVGILCKGSTAIMQRAQIPDRQSITIASPAQSKEIINAARNSGLGEPALRTLCDTLGHPPEDMEIPPLNVSWSDAVDILDPRQIHQARHGNEHPSRNPTRIRQRPPRRPQVDGGQLHDPGRRRLDNNSKNPPPQSVAAKPDTPAAFLCTTLPAGARLPITMTPRPDRLIQRRIQIKANRQCTSAKADGTHTQWSLTFEMNSTTASPTGKADRTWTEFTDRSTAPSS